ncbi:MAG: exodeoxyribonuclease VII large subunit [Candidatus Phytoplasma sp. TWB_XP]
MKSKLKDKFKLFDVPVQTQETAKKITNIIHQANKDKKVDVLIIARGGGGSDDLSFFNDVSIIKAIYESKIPIVIGIGRADDYTLLDYVAYKNADNPSDSTQVLLNFFDTKNNK